MSKDDGQSQGGTMSDHIDEIVRKLTKAQRDAVLAMPDRHLDRWNRRTRWPTQRVLKRHELIAYMPLRPTPLGLAVRARLEERND